MLEEVVQSSRSGLDYRAKEGNVCRWDDVTDRTECQTLPAPPPRRDKITLSPLRYLFIKPFVIGKISHGKLSGPFSPLFPQLVLFRWKCHWKIDESIRVKWNIPTLHFWWPHLSQSWSRWIKATRWHALSLDLTHFRLGQMKVKNGKLFMRKAVVWFSVYKVWTLALILIYFDPGD